MEKFRDGWVRLSLIVSLLVPVYFLIASLGTKFGMIDWTVGFGMMTFRYGLFVLGGALALALIALLLALLIKPRRGWGSALIALAVPLALVGFVFMQVGGGARMPAIHDISTDAADPPGFTQTVVDARAAVRGGNSLDLLGKRTQDGRTYVEVQAEAYPDIVPIETARPPGEVWDAALALAQTQGWTIGHTDKDAGVIEATARTFWYGFTDDVVIRVRATETGSRVDMRSVSRVGRGDAGANAGRMRPYLAALRAELGAGGVTP